MKVNPFSRFSVITAISAVLLLGCRKENLKVEGNQIKPEPVRQLSEVERMASLLEIWECTNGTFELKIDGIWLGTHQTINDARTEKTNHVKRAIDMRERERMETDNKLKPHIRPDCGKRIE